MPNDLKISVVIPHAGGWDLLERCLKTLSRSENVEIETIVVENGSFEIITDKQVAAFPGIQILHYESQQGFAGACNRGVEAATGKYVFLLNNDTEVEPDTLYLLSRALEKDETIAACQPKFLSLRNKRRFDYSSACGGEIDRFGFPFARGRVFDTIEDDHGQYNSGGDIFWGAGAALMLRRELYLSAGGLEERFFAHMEEIDLQWRFHLMGYRVVAVPEAKVYHLGAATISEASFTKMYLNHRNNLAMIFRNYGIKALLKYLPARWLFDSVLMIFSIFRLDLKRSFAVWRARCWFWLNLSYLIGCRKRVQELRRVPDRLIMRKIYPHSVVWQYFFHKRRTYKELYLENSR